MNSDRALLVFTFAFASVSVFVSVLGFSVKTHGTCHAAYKDYQVRKYKVVSTETTKICIRNSIELFRVSCLVSRVSCLVSRVSCLVSRVSCLEYVF